MSTPLQLNGRSPRLFTESDELRLLRSLRKISAVAPSHEISAIDSSALNRIVNTLGSKFTPTQVKDKVRGLKKKYTKQNRSKSLIKTDHDRRIFNIARGIWGKSTEKQTKTSSIVPHGDVIHETENDRSLEEEKEEEEEEGADEGDEGEDMVSDLSAFPALVSEFSRFFPENSVWREELGRLGESKLKELNEKWRMLRMDEVRLMARRAELAQEQSTLLIDAMESSFSSPSSK